MYYQSCGPCRCVQYDFIAFTLMLSSHKVRKNVCMCLRWTICIKISVDGSYISFISVFFIFHHHDNPKSHPGGHVRKRDEVCRAFDWNGPWLFNYSCATMTVLKCSFWWYRNTHTYTHTYIHTFIRSYFYTFIHSYIHTFTHTHIHTFTHTHVHTYTHIHTFTQTHIHTHIRTYTHIHIHTYTRTYIHTYIHTVKGNEMTQHVQHALLRQHAVTAKHWLKRMEKRDASRDSAWHSSATSNKGTTWLR